MILATDVHLLVTCTNRKTVSPVASLTWRTLSAQKSASRARSWITRLRNCEDPFHPVEKLYSGDHWSVVRSLVRDPEQMKRCVSIWVCSAGYGLIPFRAEIAAYAATFSPNHADSVTCESENGTGSLTRRQWWNSLSTWARPLPGSPRTISRTCKRTQEQRHFGGGIVSLSRRDHR